MMLNGGRFDFDDGGTYCGGWEEGKAHGHGVCTGPRGQGEYAGAWHYGFEVSGCYTWPSGNTYEGQWQNGKRHGNGVEHRGRWIYRGEWTQGYKGRYGHRQSINSQARYQGTWSSGLHDGYGTETYADGGTYQGQWLRGMRHGYGIRKSAPYGIAAKFRSRSHAHASLTSLRSELGGDEADEQQRRDGAGTSTGAGGASASSMTNSKHHQPPNNEPSDENRGGFVLKARSEAPHRRRRSLSERSLAVKRTILTGLRITKQHSTGDIHQRVMGSSNATGSIRSSGSTMSCTSDDSGGDDIGSGGQHTARSDHHHHHHHHPGEIVSPPEEHIDAAVVETYRGEWKNDKRSGYGVCERSDGLRYEGEWLFNKKYGYGMTTFKDGTSEEGKYKYNVLVSSHRKKGGLMFVRSSKLRERVEAAVQAAIRAASLAQQRADVAISRTTTAKDRAEQANYVASQAREDSNIARAMALQFDPNFYQPGADMAAARNRRIQMHATSNHVSFEHSPPIRSADSHDDQSLPISQELAIGTPAHLPTINMPPTSTTATMEYQRPSDSIHPQQPSSSHQQFHQHNHHRPTTNVPQPALPPDRTQILPPDRTSDLAPDRTPDLSSRSPPTPDHHRGYDNPAPMSHSSSRMSLSDDHFDQYMLAANPAAAKLVSNRNNRPNRPSLHRQPDAIGGGGASSEVHQPGGGSTQLIRRSTLASSRDRNRIVPLLPTAATTEQPLSLLDDHSVAGGGMPRGSLPNLAELDALPIQMRREEAARLASQQRQETQRQLEERQLMWTNPLRILTRPAIRTWLMRWKVPLLLTVANVCLLLVFYQLLTYDKASSGGSS